MNLLSASPQTTVHAQPPGETDTRLRGRWLLLARVVWVGIAVLTLGLLVASIDRPGVPLCFMHRCSCDMQ